MTRPRKSALFILIAMASATTALAQTQEPTRTTDDPAAASSPHQRDATKTPAQEAPTTSATNPTDAASPHQQQTMSKAQKEQWLKDCVKKEQAKDSSLSKDEVKKACTEQMSMHSDKQAKDE